MSDTSGKGCDVLIHEATFENTDWYLLTSFANLSSFRERAIKKAHSTTSEALHVAFLMQAKRLILTHFSQRFPKIPITDFCGQDKGNEDGGINAGLLHPSTHLAALNISRVNVEERIPSADEIKVFLPLLSLRI